MKKLLLGAVVGLALLVASPAVGQKVGDPMPDPAKMGLELVREAAWYWPETEAYGGERRLYRSVLRDNEPKQVIDMWVAATQWCDGKEMKHYVGVFHVNTKTLYLDYVPRDGIIDEVVVNPVDRRVSGDTKKCEGM